MFYLLRLFFFLTARKKTKKIAPVPSSEPLGGMPPEIVAYTSNFLDNKNLVSLAQTNSKLFLAVVYIFFKRPLTLDSLKFFVKFLELGRKRQLTLEKKQIDKLYSLLHNLIKEHNSSDLIQKLIPIITAIKITYYPGLDDAQREKLYTKLFLSRLPINNFPIFSSTLVKSPQRLADTNVNIDDHPMTLEKLTEMVNNLSSSNLKIFAINSGQLVLKLNPPALTDNIRTEMFATLLDLLSPAYKDEHITIITMIYVLIKNQKKPDKECLADLFSKLFSLACGHKAENHSEFRKVFLLLLDDLASKDDTIILYILPTLIEDLNIFNNSSAFVLYVDIVNALKKVIANLSLSSKCKANHLLLPLTTNKGWIIRHAALRLTVAAGRTLPSNMIILLRMEFKIANNPAFNNSTLLCLCDVLSAVALNYDLQPYLISVLQSKALNSIDDRLTVYHCMMMFMRNSSDKYFSLIEVSILKVILDLEQLGEQGKEFCAFILLELARMLNNCPLKMQLSLFDILIFNDKHWTPEIQIHINYFLQHMARYQRTILNSNVFPTLLHSFKKYRLAKKSILHCLVLIAPHITLLNWECINSIFEDYKISGQLRPNGFHNNFYFLVAEINFLAKASCFLPKDLQIKTLSRFISHAQILTSLLNGMHLEIVLDLIHETRLKLAVGVKKLINGIYLHSPDILGLHLNFFRNIIHERPDKANLVYLSIIANFLPVEFDQPVIDSYLDILTSAEFNEAKDAGEMITSLCTTLYISQRMSPVHWDRMLGYLLNQPTKILSSKTYIYNILNILGVHYADEIVKALQKYGHINQPPVSLQEVLTDSLAAPLRSKPVVIAS